MLLHKINFKTDKVTQYSTKYGIIIPECTWISTMLGRGGGGGSIVLCTTE